MVLNSPKYFGFLKVNLNKTNPQIPICGTFIKYGKLPSNKLTGFNITIKDYQK